MPLLLPFILLLLSCFTNNNDTKNLQINFSNINEMYNQKTIYIAFWQQHPKHFLNEDKADFVDQLRIDKQNATFNKAIKPGIYAISAFVDVNDNQQLDSNFLGIPKEPYCFSNNYKPMFSAPTFNNCAITIKNDCSITLEMIH